MKLSLLSIFLCFSNFAISQDLTDWQVGINANPFLFSRFNSELLFFQKSKQDFPNGFGYGLTIEKNWNDHWGIKTGFEISNQKEKYTYSTNTDVVMEFDYFKVPLTVQYYLPMTEKLYLTFNQGLQFSYLNYYKTVIQDEYQSMIRTSTFAEDTYVQFPENNTYNANFNGLNHADFLFGIIGSVGLKGFLTSRISYSTNIRYEYDINSADKLPYYSENPGNTEQKGTTHNFRIGVEVGIQYRFALDFYRFNKSPRKL